MPSKKPMSDSELSAWEDARDMAAELEQSVKEMLVGNTNPIPVRPVAIVRMETGLSESLFAELIGVSVRTLRDWEQGRRQPSGAAKTLLTVAMRHPHVLRELIDL